MMATVLVDRYSVKCAICGWHDEFMVGAGMGDFHAVERANALHSQQVSRLCKSDLTVVKQSTRPSPRERGRNGFQVSLRVQSSQVAVFQPACPNVRPLQYSADAALLQQSNAGMGD